MRITNAVVLALAVAGGCSSPDDEPAEAERVEPAAPALSPGTFAREEFAQLRFLEGEWRGEADGQPFFERYRMTSDTTIRMHSLADSTLAIASDSSLIYWRDGRIYSEGEDSRYVVATIDSAGVRFVPERGRNEFTWKATEYGWTATLRWTDASGAAQSRVYEMHPVRR